MKTLVAFRFESGSDFTQPRKVAAWLSGVKLAAIGRNSVTKFAGVCQPCTGVRQSWAIALFCSHSPDNKEPESVNCMNKALLNFMQLAFMIGLQRMSSFTPSAWSIRLMVTRV